MAAKVRERRGRGGGALIIMHRRSRMTVENLARLQCWDGARRVFTDQADIACPKLLRSAVRCWASRTNDELHPTKNRAFEAGFLACG